MYELQIRKSTEEEIKKFIKKDRKTAEILNKKINEILDNPYRFKPLRAPMQGYWRVHIGKSYVLVYSIDDKTKLPAPKGAGVLN